MPPPGHHVINHSGSPIVQPNPLTNSTTALLMPGIGVSPILGGPRPPHPAFTCRRRRWFPGLPNTLRHQQPQIDLLFSLFKCSAMRRGRPITVGGGDNLYGTVRPTGTPGVAFAVLSPRPIVYMVFRSVPFQAPQDFLFGAEYSAIYWLEENGYDVLIFWVSTWLPPLAAAQP